MLQTLQVNLGYFCNQTYIHSQVNVGPNRTEMMDDDFKGSAISSQNQCFGCTARQRSRCKGDF